jgi:hypothetical protein
LKLGGGMLNGQPIHFAGFAALFVGAWLAVTGLLGVMSGWFRLQSHYPASGEEPLRTLRAESGVMGTVQFHGCLVLSACPSGLRVAVWPLFGPLEKPFIVPWAEIHAQHVPSMFGASAQLSFGDDIGSMRIKAKSWEMLAAVARARPSYN